MTILIPLGRTPNPLQRRKVYYGRNSTKEGYPKMPGERFVFLDFDDTLSDPFHFHAQFVRELGGLLSVRYGGSAEHWAKAAIDLLTMLEAEYVERFEGRPFNGYCAWLAEVRERSTVQMFRGMGIAAPPEPARVTRETQFEALRRCNALFPGAAEAIRELYAAGYRIHIASGQESEYLTAALLGVDLADCTGRKFGPDLVDCAKEGPEYYAKVFAAVGAQASNTVVVDDYPLAIGWAQQAGAAVIQSKMSRERHYETAAGAASVMNDLRGLPGLVEAIFAKR